MGNLEGRTLLWKAPPFHFNYTYEGESFEYTLMNPYCFEKDKNCIDDSKSWALVSWIIVAVVVACVLVGYAVVQISNINISSRRSYAKTPADRARFDWD